MGEPLWMPKRRIEVAFRTALLDIAKGIVMRVGETSDPQLVVATLEHIAKTPDFIRLSEAIALKMVTGLFDDTARTWREAAQNNGRGKEIYAALQKELLGARGARIRALVKENAALIKTLPKHIADNVTAYVARETMKGRRASDIADEIRSMFPKDTKARAQLIARTQVSMTQTNLVRARAEDLGLDWYVWREQWRRQDAQKPQTHERRTREVERPARARGLVPAAARRRNTVQEHPRTLPCGVLPELQVLP